MTSLSPERTLNRNGLGAPGMHALRVRRMLFLGSAITAVTCLLWGTFFAVRGDWFIVAVDVATITLAGTTAWLTYRGRLRAASRLMLAMMYVVLCINAAVLDIPTAEVPRSTHVFLLALGVVSCLLIRDETVWLRRGIPLVCFATYLVFASSRIGWVTPFAMPDAVRSGGVWANNAVALIVVYLALHVIQNDVAERNVMEIELRDALVHGELLLHYQPQVAAGERVIGAEVLVRWNHPKRGMVSPGEFIPLAEQTGLMQPLGDWVMRTACAQLGVWRLRAQTAQMLLAVNVSASQFAQPDFVARVLACVEQAGADPSRLKLELTESMLAHDLEDIIAKMTALKARGIGFSLDDFGTGFSSLSYLRRLPLDQLKIDQSFVRNMLDSPKEAAIAQALVSLGASLGLQVIAEGVETREQRDHLRKLGCDTYQGFLFSRPLGVLAFEELLAASVAEEAPPVHAARAIASAA
ncbi:MAG: EAL domain-containing protein [Rhizobacter sp.]|nr:EAL domain-containing protein [Rhizobacter sp.]